MKKSQVDVALTIGAIIIPLAALMGSLVFAWAIISPYTDAYRLAATISHDMATLIDISYAVPDDISINYRVPSQCRFYNTTPGGPKNKMVCLGGFMNVSGSEFRYFYRTDEIQMVNSGLFPSLDNIRNVPSSIESGISITLGADAVVTQTYPARVPMPAHANIKDAGVSTNNPAGVAFDVNGDVTVTKTRRGVYDTINNYDSTKDFLRETVSYAIQACLNGVDKESDGALYSPIHYNLSIAPCGYYCVKSTGKCTPLLDYDKVYYVDSCAAIGCDHAYGSGASAGICVDSANLAYTKPIISKAKVLCVHRFHQNPSAIDIDNPAYRFKSDEYCFDFKEITNSESNCTFVLDPSLDNIPNNGTMFNIKATVGCLKSDGTFDTCTAATPKLPSSYIAASPHYPIYKITISQESV